MKQSDIEVSYVDHMGSDLSVVNAARVSFHKTAEWGNEEGKRILVEGADGGVYDVIDPCFKGELKESDAKLVRYLAKHKHFSPFNHSFLTVRVKAPIFVARQLVKHKFMPWNEVSRRYVDDEPEFYMPALRKRAENVKQGSTEEVIGEFECFANYCGLKVYADEYMSIGLALYADSISKGMAPEVARAFLPQNMMTEWMWSGTLGAFTDMLRLRLDPHTQYESRIVANKIKEIITPLFPVSVAALLDI